MPMPSVLIQDYMREVMATFTLEMDVLRAVHLLLEKEISGAPIIDRLGNMVGFLSERDVMDIALSSGYHKDFAGNVGQYMSTTVSTVDAKDSILEAARMFRDKSFKTLPVMQDNRLVGMLTRRDVLKAFQVSI